MKLQEGVLVRLSKNNKYKEPFLDVCLVVMVNARATGFDHENRPHNDEYKKNKANPINQPLRGIT